MSESNGDSKKPGGRGKSRKSPLAVALNYEPDTDKAPKVIAKGKDAIAEQILQIAFALDIKVREDAELAEILNLIDVDSEIPLEAFAAVAEILAYVYRANATMPPLAGGTAPTEEPTP
ncbi:MAG: EscU/YscU/HrcU family type III secretion system export apparatus switch protein [Rhodospirillales bacterium]|nr:EscU/YscU/HrcU family type III secretion system export apparatus switch protein [Rhodospirillales bacterium]